MRAQYCFSCMNELAGQVAICPYCHASQPYHMQDANDLPAGMILKKRYLVGRSLGRGGFGATYIARDLKNNKILTIKEYFPDFACVRNPGSNDVAFKNGKEDKFLSYQEEFKAEAQHLKLLKGVPGVVQFYEYFEAFGTSYLVLEYLDGHTLKDILLAQQRPFGIQQAVDYTLRTLQVLSRVHAKGVLHRDISPDNIFLTANGQIHLIDFGSSSLSSQTTMTGFTKGVYTAPEQRINGAQGPATDLYAVGVTLFTLLTNHKPKEAEGVQLDKLPDVFPPYLQEIYEKATRHDMGDRYQSADEMALALSQASGVPLPFVPTNRNQKLKKVLFAMIALVTVLVVAMVLAFSGSNPAPGPVATVASRAPEMALPVRTDTPAPVITQAPALPENAWLYRQDGVLYYVSAEKPEAIPENSYPVEEALLQKVELQELQRCYMIYGLSRVGFGPEGMPYVQLQNLSDSVQLELLPGEYEIVARRDEREWRETFTVPAKGPVAFSPEGEAVMAAWWNDETPAPTEKPTAVPTVAPTEEPTATPTVAPTEEPTATPTVKPTKEPTATPTVKPTKEPTATPTVKPTKAPTATPTVKPTAEPTATPVPTKAPCNHVWDAVDAVLPTCLEGGCRAYRLCRYCGAINGNTQEMPPLGHDWQEATCQSPQICIRCGVTEGEPASHRYGNWVVERKANCEQFGISCTACEFCGQQIWEVSGDPLGHDYVDGVCSRCGQKKNSALSETAAPCQHTWQDATCTQPKTCTLCGATEGEATGHYFAGNYCVYCGAATECSHTWQDATCTQPKTCTRCGATEGEATGHYFAGNYCVYCGAKNAN